MEVDPRRTSRHNLVYWARNPDDSEVYGPWEGTVFHCRPQIYLTVSFSQSKNRVIDTRKTSNGIDHLMTTIQGLSATQDWTTQATINISYSASQWTTKLRRGWHGLRYRVHTTSLHYLRTDIKLEFFSIYTTHKNPWRTFIFFPSLASRSIILAISLFPCATKRIPIPSKFISSTKAVLQSIQRETFWLTWHPALRWDSTKAVLVQLPGLYFGHEDCALYLTVTSKSKLDSTIYALNAFWTRFMDSSETIMIL